METGFSLVQKRVGWGSGREREGKPNLAGSLARGLARGACSKKGAVDTGSAPSVQMLRPGSSDPDGRGNFRETLFLPERTQLELRHRQEPSFPPQYAWGQGHLTRKGYL